VAYTGEDRKIGGMAKERAFGSYPTLNITASSSRPGYTVECVTSADMSRTYTIVSPSGVHLYSFADPYAADSEVATLNGGVQSTPGQLVRAHVAPPTP